MTPEKTEQFVSLLAGAQNRVFAYIVSLLGDPNWADDVLQETNLVLWRKAQEYKPGTPFDAWACRVAYFQVLAARRDAGRDRLLFDDNMLESLAGQAEQRAGTWDDFRSALRVCLEKLSGPQRDMLRRRYGEGITVTEIAKQDNDSSGAVSSALYRIRQSLMTCIRRTLRQEDSAR